MREKGIRRNEALLWLGGWTSRFGNILFDYANSVSIAGAFTGRPWILAAYQSSETLMQILFNLVGGASADRGDRKKIVIVTDLLAAVVCGSLSFFVDSGYMAQVMIAANAMLALIYAFNSPTCKSLIRDVIEIDRIGFFNGISHAGGELISVAGPVIGVALVGVIGVRGALLFDAFTFAVSAIAEAFLTKVRTQQEMPKHSRRSVPADIAEGFGYLVREKKILFLQWMRMDLCYFVMGLSSLGLILIGVRLLRRAFHTVSPAG